MWTTPPKPKYGISKITFFVQQPTLDKSSVSSKYNNLIVVMTQKPQFDELNYKSKSYFALPNRQSGIDKFDWQAKVRANSYMQLHSPPVDGVLMPLYISNELTGWSENCDLTLSLQTVRSKWHCAIMQHRTHPQQSHNQCKCLWCNATVTRGEEYAVT